MQEIWRDIIGYEGLYQVSNFGNVKSLGNGLTNNSIERIKKARKDRYGYLRTSLCKDNKKKTYTIHRLVALAFLPNPDSLPQVNHKDEDKTNNRVDNLEWCSAKYNSNYGSRIKRFSASKSKKVLCVETCKIYPSTKQVERVLGFKSTSISQVCRGERKSLYGFHWRYVN